MKKILVGIATVVALSSTAAMADTPAVKELNDYSHILAVGNQNRESKASEFVIYHQNGHRPCGPKGKMHHDHGKKEEHKHHHHHHDGKKAKDQKPAAPATSGQ